MSVSEERKEAAELKVRKRDRDIQEVKLLKNLGYNTTTIYRRTGLARSTIRKYLES